jgi:hypothetical protein
LLGRRNRHGLFGRERQLEPECAGDAAAVRIRAETIGDVALLDVLALGAGIKRQILPISRGHANRTSLATRGVQLSAFPTAEADAKKASGIRSSIIALPADEPLASAAENPRGTRPIVTSQVETDQGVAGSAKSIFLAAR